MELSGGFDIYIGVIQIEILTFLILFRMCFQLKKTLIELNVYSFLGQPRRHLLTTGWSIFVSQKNLVAGDAVLFLRCE